MFVGWHMTRNPVTVSPDTPLPSAREIMEKKGFSHLPVVDDKGRLCGIITDRDIKKAWASPATTLSVYEFTYLLGRLKVSAVMTRDVITAHPGTSVERAAWILRKNRIGALPVVNDRDKVVGILTVSDLLDLILLATGITEDSARLLLFVGDRTGAMADVSRILQQAGINLRSALTVTLPDHQGIWQLIIRVNIAVKEAAARALEDAGYRVLTHYVEDLSPYLSE
ncbi:acetoin utilization protein AcuB [Desulfacinum infernum DSM 9756]|uniref:Acetoin utilization protein AcuB n=1 Tax=Desulfacinum infernum DSM 9756 TaxID=1121391 RepID=A0A1M5F8E8_9BACT|nr:CBS domain-containing protein [Desulfacinum infernum]SHF87658.1 acetoin utilization protein AcuB [Desulfacinum infernum DSM 9756]